MRRRRSYPRSARSKKVIRSEGEKWSLIVKKCLKKGISSNLAVIGLPWGIVRMVSKQIGQKSYHFYICLMSLLKISLAIINYCIKK